MAVYRLLGLDPKARTASASSRCIRVFHPERGSTQGFDEINDAAAHQIKTDWVNNELHAVCFTDRVIGSSCVRKIELVLKA